VDSTLSHSRPLGQSLLPLDENAWVLSICMLPRRRSSHVDSSPSLRLFALGLRANKFRLVVPFCLGGSPFSFIDPARGVLLFVLLLKLCSFVLSAALLDIYHYQFLLPNNNIILKSSYFLLLLLVQGFFFAVGVTLLYSLTLILGSTLTAELNR